MSSILGDTIKLSLFGESHGEAIGIVIDGLASGIPLDLDFINHQMNKRKAKGNTSTARKEADEVHIISGFFNGYTTGTPLTILIQNTNTHSKDYSKTKDILRPSHADYTAYEKYNGYQDYRGGGHFSGRLTAPIVAAGAICMQILKHKGIEIGTHIYNLHGILDTAFSEDTNLIKDELHNLDSKDFPVLNEEIEVTMKEEILKYKEALNSVGGILESVVIGVEAGIGEPFADSIESKLSSLIFSIPAVKGIEFGLGFDFATTTGLEANDAFIIKDNNIQTRTNNNGGINGGISNGMPIRIKTCIKPTPSIYAKQDSVNYQLKEETTLQIEGRHDPAIIHRAAVVVDSMIAIGLLDLYTKRYGYMWQCEE